jgi:hypothetical protein
MQSISEPLVAAIELLRQTVDQEGLTHAARLNIVAIVHRAIVPKRPPGRKNQELDSAYAEYKAGIRGLKLFRKHIPNYDRLSRWRRNEKQNRLLKALQKRAERERKRQQSPTDRQAELSPRQSVSGSCHPDNAA